MTVFRFRLAARYTGVHNPAVMTIIVQWLTSAVRLIFWYDTALRGTCAIAQLLAAGKDGAIQPGGVDQQHALAAQGQQPVGEPFNGRGHFAMPRSKGRTGRPWRRAAQAVRDATDICSICGHGGARTVHHDPPLQMLEALGLDPRDPAYLRVAHGAPRNPCPTCGRNCNQIAGSKPGFTLSTVTSSRNW